jgi:hypothetical protein
VEEQKGEGNKYAETERRKKTRVKKQIRNEAGLTIKSSVVTGTF